MNAEDDFKIICGLTTRVLGLPDGSLALRSRKRPLQVARAVAGYIARSEENIHRSIIGKGLNRHRSLIYHYEKTHKSNYATCIVYRNTFNKIYSAYKKLDKTLKVFLDDDFLKNHLLKNGVVENERSQVYLEIRSGNSIFILKTSYFDFANQLENVKLALKNYHFSVKII
tara:strand:- start:248 stop:757 length:510 start_codon:yes stop_codon:yes gene_type:complete